jgi:hypothetical protein
LKNIININTQAPNMGSFILDFLVPKQRVSALRTLLRAHRPGQLPLPFLAQQLGFEDIEGQQGLLSYLEAGGIEVTSGGDEGGGGGDAQLESTSDMNYERMYVDTKTCSKAIDLEKISDWEGTSGNLL